MDAPVNERCFSYWSWSNSSNNIFKLYQITIKSNSVQYNRCYTNWFILLNLSVGGTGSGICALAHGRNHSILGPIL